jgi:cellulose synthase operon protein C
MRTLRALAAALLFASVASAQAALPADCWNLRKHGHAAEAQICFENLTRSGDTYFRAEGLWGLEAWEQPSAL